MTISGAIKQFSKELKILIFCFLITLSIGFYTGLLFVNSTTSGTINGIEINYNGNENNVDVEVMKFKKTSRDILSTIHSHILSMSLIFVSVGFLLLSTKLHKRLKLFLIIEPFISLVLTFGGLYLVWNNVHWFTYIVMFSGILMTLTYTLSVSIIMYQLLTKRDR
jgi:membrane-bound ClpP family serine protease